MEKQKVNLMLGVNILWDGNINESEEGARCERHSNNKSNKLEIKYVKTCWFSPLLVMICRL